MTNDQNEGKPDAKYCMWRQKYAQRATRFYDVPNLQRQCLFFIVSRLATASSQGLSLAACITNAAGLRFNKQRHAPLLMVAFCLCDARPE